MKIETPTTNDIRMAEKAVGSLGRDLILHNLDERYISRKDGVVLMWSTEGNRITFSGGAHGIIVSRKKEVDPEYPGSVSP